MRTTIHRLNFFSYFPNTFIYCRLLHHLLRVQIGYGCPRTTGGTGGTVFHLLYAKRADDVPSHLPGSTETDPHTGGNRKAHHEPVDLYLRYLDVALPVPGALLHADGAPSRPHHAEVDRVYPPAADRHLGLRPLGQKIRTVGQMDNGLIRIPVLPLQTRTTKARATLVILTFCILGDAGIISLHPLLRSFSIFQFSTRIQEYLSLSFNGIRAFSVFRSQRIPAIKAA